MRTYLRYIDVLRGNMWSRLIKIDMGLLWEEVFIWRLEMKPQCPNLYWWNINGGLRYYALPRLRQPAPGEPDVPDLIRPGDWFVAEYEQTSPSEGLVMEVAGPFWDSVAGQKVKWYSILFVTREDLKRERRPHSEHWSIINEVVAWKGELRGLFEADTKRIRVVPIPEDIHLPDWAKAVVHRGKQLRLL